MEYQKIQQKIDELDDFIKLNPGHHQLLQINNNKKELQEQLNEAITKIEIINPIQL